VAPFKSVDGRKQVDDTPATTHKMSSTRIGDSTEDQLTNKHVWAKTYAMMPRTANNYHKMKKGLYLNSLKGTVYDLQRRDSHSPASTQVVNGGRNRTNRPSNAYYDERRTGDGYMTVIKESPRLQKQREDLKARHRKIVDMNFETKRKTEVVAFINQFMADRVTGRTQGSTSTTSDSRQKANDRAQIRSIYTFN